VKELAAAGVDVIVYACLLGYQSGQGLGWSEAFIEEGTRHGPSSDDSGDGDDGVPCMKWG
jgi:hypothetical protein